MEEGWESIEVGIEWNQVEIKGDGFSLVGWERGISLNFSMLIIGILSQVQ